MKEAIKKFIPQNFNDLMALLVIFLIIPIIWILDGLQIVKFNPEVIGASILSWGLITQYYFRKAKEEK